jgi:hypothetical protein
LEDSKNISVTNRGLKERNTGINPLEKANAILSSIETMKRNESDRIIKQFINQEYDDNTKFQIQKILRYLFGKAEADEIGTRFLREKRVNQSVCPNLRYMIQS